MSELIQEQEDYIKNHEFSEKEIQMIDPLPHFMPLWTARVLDGDQTSDIVYANSSRCLVGEAHGMSNSYTDQKENGFIDRILHRTTKCKYCNTMSFESSKRGSEKTALEVMDNKIDFIEFKKNMYRHMQKHHKKEFKKLWLKK